MKTLEQLVSSGFEVLTELDGQRRFVLQAPPQAGTP
jgi:hypothetical protein